MRNTFKNHSAGHLAISSSNGESKSKAQMKLGNDKLMNSTDSAMTDAATNQRAIITLCALYKVGSLSIPRLSQYSWKSSLDYCHLGAMHFWSTIVYRENKIDIMTGNTPRSLLNSNLNRQPVQLIENNLINR